MNWLTNFVRPKLRALVSRDVPDNLWKRCNSCEQMIFHRDLLENLFVCQHCGHHMHITPKLRLESLFDKAEYSRVEIPDVPLDPLKFRDLKKYTDRLKESRQRTNEKDAVQVAYGTINSNQAVIAVFDFSFMGGSMGTAVGEALVTAANTAVSQRAALIIIPSSGGARMQEGILSLMQMPRTIIGTTRVKEAKLPYITILTNPTTGGVSASFAMLGDITIAEPDAIIGFAGARVIQQTIRENLPAGFQKSEYLLEHGMVDMVVPRAQLQVTLSKILDVLKGGTKPNLALTA